ncbi:hypothetical protein IFM89_003436 [Coptis chinensis]|uniref:Disease resistance RPP13-like protein 4 n=1 Tax=Coptis chinensis TaxID=261450 RepID=A0A835LCJ2_9MAGN|nr:hypothetical protein IFM89_003436 [Coptis chinensis]
MSVTVSSQKSRDETCLVIRKARQYIKSIFSMTQKSVLDRLEDKTRETDDILYNKLEDDKKRLNEIQVEVENIKKKVISCLKDLQPPIIPTAAGASEEKGKTNSIDQPLKDPEAQRNWPDLDTKLEEILENAAMIYMLSDYNKLGENFRKCLLCLSIFPQGSIIKKRTIIYWWIGEGFVKATAEKTAEEVGEKWFNDLVEGNWIHPAKNKSSKVVREFTMDPWVRWLVIYLARQECFFDLDETGMPSSYLIKSSRACLLKMDKPESNPSTLREQGHSNQEGSSRGRSVVSVFNGDAERLSAQYLFSKMKEVKKLFVLQLGRWHSKADHHIEFVDGDSETLHRLGLLKSLRYLSLAGISRITELPTSVKNLLNLRVLDLRSCQNLEKLGEEIRFLSKLDVSECYLLDHMPKALGSLSQLEVLKGFVIGSKRSKDPCKLEELTKLKKLKKLSISIGGEANIHTKDMNDEDRSTLKGNWTELSYPPGLEKLDLFCFPEQVVWLDPASLEKLNRLYIRGGQVEKLGFRNESNTTMKVGMLRLKFLHKLTVKWPELEVHFPHLNYLEIHDCPHLEDSPLLDSEGVWIAEAKSEQGHFSHRRPDTSSFSTGLTTDASQNVAPILPSEPTGPSFASSSQDEGHALARTTTSSASSTSLATIAVVGPSAIPGPASVQTDTSSSTQKSGKTLSTATPQNTFTSVPPQPATSADIPPKTPGIASAQNDAPTLRTSSANVNEHAPAPNDATNAESADPSSNTGATAPVLSSTPIDSTAIASSAPRDEPPSLLPPTSATTGTPDTDKDSSPQM